MRHDLSAHLQRLTSPITATPKSARSVRITSDPFEVTGFPPLRRSFDRGEDHRLLRDLMGVNPVDAIIFAICP